MNQWTDSYIAKMCYVSAQFVSNRRALATIASQPTKRKFINAQGEVEWMHTTRIGKNQAPPPKADQFPPPLTAERKQNEFDMMILHRDSAHEIWKGNCQKNKINFDWEDFCLFAEKHNGGPGSVSALNPIECLFEEIQERSQTWTSIIRAIVQDVDWIVEYRNQNQSPAPNPQIQKVAAPNREGLRKNLEAMVGSDTEPNPSILTKLYNVPEAEIHAEIEEVFGGAAHNEAKEAYVKMMGAEPAEKVAEKYWDDFCDTAKKNAPRGKGLPKGKHDGTTVDRYPRDKAERIVECWEWIRDQCQPGLNNQAEQKLCNLNLLKCDPPALWIQNWIYETCCRMSDFNIVMHGLNYEGEIGRLEFKAPIPLGAEALERIRKATQEAVDFEFQEILAEHNEQKEEANAPVATRLLTKEAPTP